MSDNVRFTAYISRKEDRALRRLAKSEGTSVNYLVRCAVRALLGYEVPDHIADRMEERQRAKAS